MCWYLDMQGRAIMLRHPSNSYIVPLQFTRIRGKSQLKLYSTRGYTGTSKSDKKRRDLCMHTHACLRIMSETSLKQRENVIQNGREYCLFRYCILGTNYYCLTETAESREKIECEKKLDDMRIMRWDSCFSSFREWSCPALWVGSSVSNSTGGQDSA